MPERLRSGPLAVSLAGVRVRYGAAEALRDVDLHVAAGSCTAVVGTSGAGKSTLVDVMLGLAPLAEGRVLFNGVSLAELPLTALRRRVGYMGQETVLYNASIRDNIIWGRSPCSEDELTKAVRLSGAERFVARLDAGLDASVGDRGTLLSGGERQRIALARAALGTPGLLILDEATSALDAESERAVTDGVAALKGRSTVIIIAHRLSTARIADEICVLETGRIVERGTWSELLARRGRFYALWQLQHADEAASDVQA